MSKFLIAGVYFLCYIGLPLTAVTAAVRFMLDLPNSRKQELEGIPTTLWMRCILTQSFITADRIGLKLSSRACFEPRAAVESVYFLCLLIVWRG